jgi:DNA modification methylase
MKEFLEENSIKLIDEKNIDSIENELNDCIIINTSFDFKSFGKSSFTNESDSYVKSLNDLIDNVKPKLKDGGLLFVYGLPNYLSFAGERISDNKIDDFIYLFKYFISCEFKINQKTDNNLPSSHMGLLMYLKSKTKKNPTPFNLNTKYTRIPYTMCLACNQETKDWGGKKHMRNPLGSAISDVWSFNEYELKNNDIPELIFERILNLIGFDKNILVVKQTKNTFKAGIKNVIPVQSNKIKEKPIEPNKVINRSCIEYLNDLTKTNPNGSFDLAFADPPYNLAKNYSTYQDDLEDQKYIDWCNEWLKGMADNLKPGGTLLVLNIPKWSIYHFNFLSKTLIFRNWIVWDALSTPSGKLLPAHYSLLYFTKPGAENTLNYDIEKNIESRNYCLRIPCVRNRKNNGLIEKEPLNDIWRDVHRIKHKKDRDQHPCQLPTKLLNRCINLFSNESDLTYDPFGGAGTTAISSKLLKRDYIITELDPAYAIISENNLNKIKQDVLGNLVYGRESVSKGTKQKDLIPKKIVESSYIKFCLTNKKIYSLSELESINPKLYVIVKLYNGDFKKLIALAKRQMEANEISLFK